MMMMMMMTMLNVMLQHIDRGGYDDFYTLSVGVVCSTTAIGGKHSCKYTSLAVLVTGCAYQVFSAHRSQSRLPYSSLSLHASIMVYTAKKSAVLRSLEQSVTTQSVNRKEVRGVTLNDDFFEARRVGSVFICGHRRCHRYEALVGEPTQLPGAPTMPESRLRVICTIRICDVSE
eukprot:207296-Amphidinium_carterae.1